MHRVLTDRGYSNPEIDQLLKTDDLVLDTVQDGQSITMRASGGRFVPALATFSLLAAALTDCGLGVRRYYETLKAKGDMQELSGVAPDIDKIDQRLASSPSKRANGNRNEHNLAWHFVI